MAVEQSLIGTTVDYAADGKQFGHLLVPHSRNESAWGTLMIPIVCIKNGDGPTLLLISGNHGDEYEGPLSVLKLVKRLDTAAFRGRLIAVPALNLPAMRADARVSPIDNGNMNRAFPGEPRGTVTQRIAHYVWSELMPLSDVVVDLHSGGHSLNFVPSAVMHELDDHDMMARTEAALKAFGAPVGLILKELDSAGMLDTAAEEMGKLFISTELGGAAMVTPDTVAITDRGLDNLLKHFGMLEGEPARPERPTRMMRTPENAYTMSTASGLYEPLVEIGEPVESGQVLGRVHFFEEPEREPVVFEAATDGMLYCRRVQGWTAHGDTLAVIVRDL